MAPNPRSLVPTGVLNENEDEISIPSIAPDNFKPKEYKVELVWKNICLVLLYHALAFYGLYKAFTEASIYTSLYFIVCYQCGQFGVLGGAHRLWSHKSYKANRPLTLLLTIFQTICYQGSVIHWSRDHRVHHKFSETDADPHNAKRGFFFAHVGWTLCRKHPLVIEQGRKIDISDLTSDPILAFQHKYYSYFMLPLFAFIIPIMVPVYFWKESLVTSICLNYFRIFYGLHGTWLINSVAHLYGNRPYDKHINPSESMVVSFTSLGEGYHNYHHTFPWDYRAAEFGEISNYFLNLNLAFIDFFAKIGWATDLKTVSREMIQKRVARTGDGSHPIWGWGDDDQTKANRDTAVFTNKKEL